MAIVYTHTRLDTNEVFYVGISVGEKRAYSTKRTAPWRAIANKTEYRVDITHTDLVWEEACAIEKYLIDFYGRRDLGKGPLVNLTDGGDGRYGAVATQATRDKMSTTRKGLNTWQKQRYLDGLWNPVQTFTDEYRKKISNARKGKPNNWLGRKHSAESIQKMKEAKAGEKHNRYGVKLDSEVKGKMSESAKNRVKIECPHCHKLGDPGPMKYWHFDNCKKIKQK